MLDHVVTLALLILLQAVLGFDNLLYISLESKRAPAHRQAFARRFGIGLVVVLRLGLLFALMRLIGYFREPIFAIHTHPVDGTFNLHAIVVLLGGAFILYTASREILHMVAIDVLDHAHHGGQSTAKVITSIVLMNLVFSFDSILSAMALSDVFWIMATAIVISGILMIALADGVSGFLQRNRMYEVLGLFILFVVGVMLVTEGGHLAHLKLFGREIMPMTKTTFYFVIGVLILTDVVQTRYRRKLMRAQEAVRPRPSEGA